MNARLLLNLGLAIFLAALISVLVFDPFKTPAPDDIKLTDLNATDIQHITIRKPGYEDIVLEKTGARWNLRAPFTAPANSARIENILAVTDATSQAQYPRAQADLAQLQLDKPLYHLEFDGLTLLFGDTQPLSQDRYVLVGDTIHLITDRYSFLLQGEAADFVDTRLLPENIQVRALSLPGLELHKESEGWIASGQQPQPSADHVNSLLDAWRFARAIKVTHISTPTAGEPITIELEDDGHSIEFLIQQTDSETLFQRPDLGLQYHVTAENAKPMLSLGAGPSPSN